MEEATETEKILKPFSNNTTSSFAAMHLRF